MHESNELLLFSKRLGRFNSTLISTLQERFMEQQAAPVYLLIGTPTYRHVRSYFTLCDHIIGTLYGAAPLLLWVYW